MSGHSKWAQIKRKKGVADAKRGQEFTKLSRAITVAARIGGGDSETNFSLRLAIERARSANVPKENITRAIVRGTGDDKESAMLEEVLYEGFGPAGVGVLVFAVTDNKNRSAADIKHLFSKHGGSLGGPGSVTWKFLQKGVVRVGAGSLSDDLQLRVMDSGAQDIMDEGDGITIYTEPYNLRKVAEALHQAGIEPAGVNLEWIPKEEVSVSEEDKIRLERFFDALDALDDVQDIYSNETS